MTKPAFPVFISVANADIEFAEQVWEHFPDDLIYLYSKTGEEAAHMWDEISERELPRAKVFVVFWSRNYLRATGCIREIKQAAGLIESGLLRPLVLRLDDCPISWSEDFTEDDKATFDALSKALDYRTSRPGTSIDHARELVSRVAEPLLASDHPRLDRPELLKSMRETLQIPNDRFQFFPALWVSGFNGVGRETLVKEYNRSFVPNGYGVTVEINEAALPRQLLLRIESEAFGASHARLEELQQAEFESETAEVAAAVERVVEAGNYLVLRHARIVEERVDLPEWLDEVVNALAPATRSKLFIISQVPLAPERRTRCRDRMVSKRISTIDEHTLREYCWQLIGHFDPQPERWTEDDVDRVVAAAGGTIGFLVTLVRVASRIEDMDQLDALIAAEGAQMVEQMTVYARWAFSQLRDFPEEQRTLIFLNDVSPCDLIDLERVVKPRPERPMLRVLGKLLELGLIEREGENLYRLTPLLSNRLNRDLVRPELTQWSRRALTEFVKNPPEVETPEHEFLRIETRIQAAMLSGEENLPNSVAKFVSAAHWFQAGIRLYHANRRELAWRLLKKAYENRNEFAQATRVEVMRYYALSAIRMRKFKDAEDVIRLLDNVHSTKAMAAFLRGNLHEFKREYFDAIRQYETALDLNQGKDSRLEHTYRPLIACILRTPKPDFEKAEHYALAYVKLRRTVFSLMALTRVYLHWKYRRDAYDREVPEDIDRLYRDALDDLSNHPGVNSAHFEIRAEEAEFEDDFAGALQFMDEAVAADPRPQLRISRWSLMARSGDASIADQVLKEMQEAKSDDDFKGNWAVYLLSLAETYGSALKAAGEPMGRLNQFAIGLQDAEIGRIVGRINRAAN